MDEGRSSCWGYSKHVPFSSFHSYKIFQEKNIKGRIYCKHVPPQRTILFFPQVQDDPLQQASCNFHWLSIQWEIKLRGRLWQHKMCILFWVSLQMLNDLCNNGFTVSQRSCFRHRHSRACLTAFSNTVKGRSAACHLIPCCETSLWNLNPLSFTGMKSKGYWHLCISSLRVSLLFCFPSNNPGLT